jgi:hypothetical protein
MPSRLLGRLHAAALAVNARALATFACVASSVALPPDRERGQGTVEYVALILLLALVFAAVVKFGAGKDFDIGKTIVDKLKSAIDGVGDAPKKG